MQCPSCDKSVESEWKLCPWCEAKLAVPCGSRTEQAAREAADCKLHEQLKLGITDADWADITSGNFLMGSPESEESRNDDERQHNVEVATFQMLKTPVTFVMFDAFCEATGRDKPKDQGWGRANRPVINVSYWDAVDYCEWLTKETDWHVRLPTEAEWEYACRAGTTTPFWTGSTISTDQANYYGKFIYGNGSKGIYREKTNPVDMFQANPWGLYDMHGNVWEWCTSEYDEDYGKMERCDARKDHSNNTYRELRGGSWSYCPRHLRSAIRYRARSAYSSLNIGFRLVQD